jgi:hypothetical protein
MDGQKCMKCLQSHTNLIDAINKEVAEARMCSDILEHSQSQQGGFDTERGHFERL